MCFEPTARDIALVPDAKFMKLPNPYTQRELAEARNLPPPNEPFAAINVSFHETYTRLVEQVLAQLGDSIPVIVLTGDGATLLCDNREQREQVIPARYHELKTLGHLAFGVQLTLMANGSGRLTELSAKELHEKRAHSGSADCIERDTGLCVLFSNDQSASRAIVPCTHARRQSSR